VNGLWLTSFMRCSSYMIWSWSIILWEFHWPKNLNYLNKRSIFIEPKFIFLDLHNPSWQFLVHWIAKRMLYIANTCIYKCSFTNHIISIPFHSIQFNSIPKIMLCKNVHTCVFPYILYLQLWNPTQHATSEINIWVAINWVLQITIHVTIFSKDFKVGKFTLWLLSIINCAYFVLCIVITLCYTLWVELSSFYTMIPNYCQMR
jgi:hypothetical protein